MPILGADGHGGWSYKFVDGIAAAPTVRLDLHSGTVRVTKGVDFGNAPIRRASSSTLLVDGDRIGASAYGNRTLRLPIHISASTPQSFRADVEVLFRELSRERNTLMVQTSDRPVFFRTYRASDAVLRRIGAAHADTILEVELVAEPFAYGLKETLPDVVTTLSGRLVHTVPSSSIKGDVPTPLSLTIDVASGGNSTLVVGSRIGSMSHETLVPADAATWTGGTSSTITSTSDVDGSSKKISGLAEGDSTTSANFPGVFLRSGQTDRRALNGRYRAFLMVGTDINSTNLFRVDLRLGTSESAYGSVVRVLTRTDHKYSLDGSTPRRLVDLGVVTVPFGRTATSSGFDGVFDAGDLSLSIQIKRLHATGSDYIVVDALLLVPADDTMMIASLNPAMVAGGSARLTLDPSGSVIARDAATGRLLVEETKASYIGQPPTLVPGQDCHIIAVDMKPGINGVTMSAAYWPRYLTVA